MKTVDTIYLTGYMGSGKSHVARILSRKLNCSLVDLDQSIVNRLSLSINEIFEKYGEAHFRQLELKELELIIGSTNKSVVSLGGGSYCQPAVQQLLNNEQHSFTVYLKYEAVFLVKRLEQEKSHRPIIKDEEDLFSFVTKHLDERNKFYENAELIIADETDIDKIIDQILAYRLYLNQKLSTI